MVRRCVEDWIEARESLSRSGQHSMARIQETPPDDPMKPGRRLTASGKESRPANSSRIPIGDLPFDVQRTDRVLKMMDQVLHPSYRQMLIDRERYASVAECAEALGCSKDHVLRMCEGGTTAFVILMKGVE